MHEGQVLRFRFFIRAALAVMATAVATPADARPLNDEDCEALAVELAAIAKSDVTTAILKGPDWTLAHMPQAMEQVKRYLIVEEQLRFRCEGRSVPDLVPETAGAPPKSEQKKATSRARLEAEMSAVLSDGNRHQGGDAPDAAPVRKKPRAPTPRNARRAPASASPARSPGLEAAYRQLFPMGR